MDAGTDDAAARTRSTMTRAPTTVFFDLDDTLFDHSFSVQAGLRSLAASFPAFARVPLARLAELHASELEVQHLRVLAGELTIDDARLARFATLTRACGAGTEVDVARVAEHYRGAYLADRRPVPGALELLRALRARRPPLCIGIITNNVVDEQVTKLRELRMSDLIDVLVVSEEAGATKPDPAIFHTALRRAGCGSPARAVMVGDAWSTDIVGARAAGIRTLWLNRHARPCPEPGTTTEIASLLPTEDAVAHVLGSARAPLP